jgi:hypothetical protein
MSFFQNNANPGFITERLGQTFVRPELMDSLLLWRDQRTQTVNAHLSPVNKIQAFPG